MKEDRAGDSFWLSIRNGLPVDSRMLPVALAGHQPQQNARYVGIRR